MHVQVPDIYEDMLTISARSIYLFSHQMLICQWQEMLFDQLQKPKLQYVLDLCWDSPYGQSSERMLLVTAKPIFLDGNGTKC
jgi:hypothetical protein